MDDFHCWYCSGVPQDTTGGALPAGIDPASPSGLCPCMIRSEAFRGPEQGGYRRIMDSFGGLMTTNSFSPGLSHRTHSPAEKKKKNLLEGVHVAYFQDGNAYESPENSGLRCQIGNLSSRLVTFSNEHLAFEILKRDPRHA